MSSPVGVVGGVGPVASAEFVRTIYAYCAGGLEQDFPAVLLHSDPSVPARSSLRDGANAELGVHLERRLDALGAQGCSTIVVCCMTLHQVLPEVADPLRVKVVSVLDVLVDALASTTPEPRLMLCSADSLRLRLFEGHPRWPAADPSVMWPSESESLALQETIQDIKENRGGDRAARWIKARMAERGVGSVIVGCSEIHALLRTTAPELAGLAVDPFDILARAIAGGRVDTLRERLARQ